MTTGVRTFSARLYPRVAIEAAAQKLQDICGVAIEDDVDGTRVTLALPDDSGDEDLMGEFSNLALVSAIEIHLHESAS